MHERTEASLVVGESRLVITGATLVGWGGLAVVLGLAVWVAIASSAHGTMGLALVAFSPFVVGAAVAAARRVVLTSAGVTVRRLFRRERTIAWSDVTDVDYRPAPRRGYVVALHLRSGDWALLMPLQVAGTSKSGPEPGRLTRAAVSRIEESRDAARERTRAAD